jgi:hypothetical protein
VWWILAAIVVAVVLFMLFARASGPRSGVSEWFDAPSAATVALAA